ncbi:DUF6954 family protein [Cohnella yongneupensis]|uniref:DUF6954 family protein n=1 Tax=Cohnella yongneupensis TaxID=425006 RepID=A0ABW0R083_9BACL
MVKWLINAIFIALYLAVAVFGIGPVLFADGSWSERIGTAIVVLVILVVLIFAHFAIMRPKYRI